MAWWRIITGIAGLIFLGIYANQNAPDQTIAELQTNPQKYIGESVTLHIETRVDSVEAKRFRIREGDKTLWIHGEIKPDNIGKSISLDGVFLSDQTIELRNSHISPGRFLKVLISIPALILVCFITIAVLKINHNALEVDEHA